MDDLEPWNMFTNDFVATESDEIFTDEIMADLQLTAECAVPSTQMKVEPVDKDEFDDNKGNIHANTNGSYAISVLKQEQESPSLQTTTENVDYRDVDEVDDDSVIFNFDMESKKQKNMDKTDINTIKFKSVNDVSASTKNYKSVQNNLSNAQVDYESAVVYICPACGSEFSTQNTWKRHMNSVHNYNTRRGLNFIQIDKLYHECLECHKRIAMHAMENLLKHKFTHLPYRCTKCKVCLRQYKYRQDLMVHLRMNHREDIISITRNEKLSEKRFRSRNTSEIVNVIGGNSDGNVIEGIEGNQIVSLGRLEIKDIKENAVDIFENTVDSIEVKNEFIEPDDDEPDIEALVEQTSSSFVLPHFLEDALSRSSSQISDRAVGSGDVGGGEEVLCEKHIQYICPQCGAEYGTQFQWRQHIEQAHDFGTRRGLNFQEINMNQHAQCLECNKVIYVNVIPNLQFHKFTHLPHKSWLRCKLCFRACVGYKEIVKHLLKQHRLGNEDEQADESEDVPEFSSSFFDDFDNGGYDNDGQQSPKSDERDIYEQHIDYLCPQCGKEFIDKKNWRKHIVKMHHLTNLQVLNFKVLNDRQVKCLECLKVITNAYGIQNAQQHRFTHMPFKAFIRCCLCKKAYTDRKGLVKHLNSKHRIGRIMSHNSYNPKSTNTSPSRSTLSLQRQPYKHPQKEIVKHANFTFEIQYLDDVDDDDNVSVDNDSNTNLSDDNQLLLGDMALPELGSSRNFVQQSRWKCEGCVSTFPTQAALHDHVAEEHPFLAYSYRKPLPEVLSTKTQSRDHVRSLSNVLHSVSQHNEESKESNDIDDSLLIPTGNEDVSFNSTQDSAQIERNFCYLCPACGLEYKAQVEWRNHINEAHKFDNRHSLNFRQIDKFRFQCIECNDIVSSSKLKGLQDHKFRHLPYKLYIKCLICSVCYNHKPNIISHLRMRHNIVDVRSSPISPNNSERLDYEYDIQHEETFPRSATSKPTIASGTYGKPPPGLRTVEDCISFHNAVDHESITYFCPQCNEPFHTHVFWRKHIVEAHNLNSCQGLNFRQLDNHHYLCLQCYKRVTVTHTKGAIGQLQSHKFRHLPYKSFKCLACNGEFVRKQMFFKHLNKKTNRCDNPMLKSTYAENEFAGGYIQEKNSVASNECGGADSYDVEDEDYNDQDIENLLVMTQNSFILLCPECGETFDSWHPWRIHINEYHKLGRRELLNFKRINGLLHECLECNEQVDGNKLRDLQIHKFKHLKYGNYIQCKLCNMSYQHIGNMKNHLQQKHPDVAVEASDCTKIDELQKFEPASMLSDNVNYVEQQEEQ